MDTLKRKELVNTLKERMDEIPMSIQDIASWIWEEIVTGMVSDSHGQYIPQIFCEDITEHECPSLGIKWDDVQACQYGPDNEWYWEAWDIITSNYDYNGIRLHQNGDLWVYDAVMLDDFMDMLSARDMDNDAIIEIIFP